MMFLIIKIFVYLCVALGIGSAAGWLLRHISAQKEVEELQRNLADSKAKVPQLETQLRAREDRIRSLSAARSEPDETVKGTRVQDDQVARQLRDKDMEVQRLKNRIEILERASGNELLDDGDLVAAEDAANDVLPAADAAPTGAALDEAAATAALSADHSVHDVDNTLIAELHREIERLKEEVASTSIQLEVAKSDDSMQQEVAELTSRLRQKAEDYDRLQKALQQEQRKVVELERERELQNKSLKVLHQQLEMVRDARE